MVPLAFRKLRIAFWLSPLNFNRRWNVRCRGKNQWICSVTQPFNIIDVTFVPFILIADSSGREILASPLPAKTRQTVYRRLPVKCHVLEIKRGLHARTPLTSSILMLANQFFLLQYYYLMPVLHNYQFHTFLLSILVLYVFMFYLVGGLFPLFCSSKKD